MSPQRRWQLDHIARGLCQSCSRPLATGAFCAVHAAAQNAGKRALYQRSKGKVRACRCGICGAVGHNRQTCAKRVTVSAYFDALNDYGNSVARAINKTVLEKIRETQG